MSLEQRVQKLEETHLNQSSVKRAVTVEVCGPDDKPRNEEEAKKLREGQEAEARGEPIQWIIIKCGYDNESIQR